MSKLRISVLREVLLTSRSLFRRCSLLRYCMRTFICSSSRCLISWSPVLPQYLPTHSFTRFYVFAVSF
jgi:hypothetical protein